MAGRRAVTEGLQYDDSDEAIDLNNLKDEELQALAMAYAMHENGEGGDEDDEDEEEGEANEQQQHGDSDVDDIDFENFKGIYFNDDPNRKYQDPETGSHFEYYDLCKRLSKLKELRKKIDKELGINTIESPVVQQQPEIKKSESTKTKGQQITLLQGNQPQKRPAQGIINQNNTNSSGQQVNQVITLQRRQIRGLQENQHNKEQEIMKQNNEAAQLKIDWLGGRNIQNYINELKQKMGVQGFRSKSHEKAQHLLMDKQQHSQRGQQIGLINQFIANPAVNQQQHRKQQSQLQHQEVQRLPSQGGNRNLIASGSNQDLNKTPESNKKRSRGELSTGGLGGNAYSFERRTYDVRRDDLNDFQINQGSIYTDQVGNALPVGRQFRNSQYSSNNKQQQQQIMQQQQQQQTQQDGLYMKAQQMVARQSNKTAYGNLSGGAPGAVQQRKTRNSAGFVMPPNNQSSSITHKMGNEEIEKMSPYFIKQKQQSLALSSQQQQKKKVQMIAEQMEISGSNPYSRNKMQDQIKTTYSQKTQDLLQSVQKNSSLINNIKYGGPLSGNNAAGKRIIPSNIQFRKSFGGPAVNGPGIQAVVGVRESLSKEGLRPATGKIKQNSQDQNKLGQLSKNDRSRQKQGLIAALPSSQQQKSVSSALVNNAGQYLNGNNQYFINKSINSFKN